MPKPINPNDLTRQIAWIKYLPDSGGAPGKGSLQLAEMSEQKAQAADAAMAAARQSKKDALRELRFTCGNAERQMRTFHRADQIEAAQAQWAEELKAAGEPVPEAKPKPARKNKS